MIPWTEGGETDAAPRFRQSVLQPDPLTPAATPLRYVSGHLEPQGADAVTNLLFASDDVVTQTAEFWNQAADFATSRGLTLLLNAVAALAIFLFGLWVSKLIRRILTKLMAKANVDVTLRKFLANIAYALLLTFVVLAAINRLGIDTTSFVAVVAAAGLAVGFALQQSLANFAAGVMLILFKPFQVGDFVEAGGSKGVVEEVYIFNTRMRTHDNIGIIVPNSEIISSTITNFSAKETRRIDLVVGCGYQDDLRAVKKFLDGLMTEDDRILKDPEPVVAVDELGDSSVNFIVRPWVKSADYGKVKWELNEKIKLGFDERGFNIPYPSQDVFVHGVTS